MKKNRILIYPLIIMGTLLMFTSSCKKEDTVSLPVLTTNTVSEITITTSTCGGNITSDGGATVTARGVCWSTGQTPTISDAKTTDGNGAGSFESAITGLAPNTSYFVRAYATNKAGTGYGSAMSFKTIEVFEPVVTTSDVSDIAQTTATFGGNISSSGGSPITERGVCWSTGQSPTIADSKIISGTGTGSFTCPISNLNPNTTYYVRAFATNAYLTGYGNAMAFTTLGFFEPELTTSDLSSITISTALCGGNITSGGGVPVTLRGVCWSSGQNPTIADSKTMDGTGSGNFLSEISGLSPNSVYYVRAYATNSIGTGYGSIKPFTTLEAFAPILTTSFVSELSQTSATFGSEITFDGNSSVTERGVCWSTEQTPTIADSKTIDGMGIGVFTSVLTGLSSNTQYYMRAYASNSYFTGYGNTLSFRTFGQTVTDIDGNVYNTIMIGTQVWMVENLKTTKYRNGDPIPNVSDATSWYNLTTGAYCNYLNEVNYSTAYGRLYNWHAVSNSRNISPNGWHVPTDAEWTVLTTYLGGENVAGGKLKEAGTTHWNSPNLGVTNETGFTGLPGGIRTFDGTFGLLGEGGYIWSSSEDSSTSWKVWLRSMEYGNIDVVRWSHIKTAGFSVRCIKDN